MIQSVAHFLYECWRNAPLMAALVAIGLTQAAKIPVHYMQARSWSFHKIVDAGGMPSSHAAGTVALTTALAYVVGPKSPTFATAVVFTAIVLYDAGGIRRHAGEHAVLLNRISQEFHSSGLMQRPLSTPPEDEGERLKEILGHEPPEVLVGAVIGVLVGIVFGTWW